MQIIVALRMWTGGSVHSEARQEDRGHRVQRDAHRLQRRCHALGIGPHEPAR